MKKLFILFGFLILTSTVFANTANPTIGGWQIISNVGQGIGAKLTATKEVIVNGSSKTISSVASISPKPTNVAKFLAKAGVVSIAIDAMDYILDGVDYVMDPANNTITYRTKVNDTSYDSPLNQYYYKSSCNGQFYATVKQVVEAYLIQCSMGSLKYVGNLVINTPSSQVGNITITGTYTYTYTGSNRQFSTSAARVINPNYDESSDKPITVPLSEVGSRVIDKAEEDIRAGNTSPAVVLSRAVAQDLVAEQSGTDENVKPIPPIAQELDKNAVIPEEGTATGEIAPTETNPDGGAFSLEFPKFCGWASSLCLFIDWMQKEPDIDDPTLPTEELEKQEIKDDLLKISSSSCPAPYRVSIELPVFNTVFEDKFDMQPYCPEIEKLAPVFQLITFVICVMILARI